MRIDILVKKTNLVLNNKKLNRLACYSKFKELDLFNIINVIQKRVPVLQNFEM